MHILTWNYNNHHNWIYQFKMFATRFAARAIPAFKQQAVVRRQLSGHSAEHAKKETETWYKATIGTLLILGNE